jgi:hypothetical protein
MGTLSMTASDLHTKGHGPPERCSDCYATDAGAHDWHPEFFHYAPSLRLACRHLSPERSCFQPALHLDEQCEHCGVGDDATTGAAAQCKSAL